MGWNFIRCENALAFGKSKPCLKTLFPGSSFGIGRRTPFEMNHFPLFKICLEFPFFKQPSNQVWWKNKQQQEDIQGSRTQGLSVHLLQVFERIGPSFSIQCYLCACCLYQRCHILLKCYLLPLLPWKLTQPHVAPNQCLGLP